MQSIKELIDAQEIVVNASEKSVAQISENALETSIKLHSEQSAALSLAIEKMNEVLETILSKSQGDFTEVENNEQESAETELMEYKYDFYQMSLGAIKSIAMHAQAIIDALENPSVKEGLTESWLQGKIAVTEDYMLTIHNFLMFGESEADAKDSRPGLWENIRKKKEKMGKNYKPAKPGDKDRPDSDQWKKLSK